MSEKSIGNYLISLGWETYDHKDPPDVAVYTLENVYKKGWFWQLHEHVEGVWQLTCRNWVEQTDVSISQMMLARHVIEFADSLAEERKSVTFGDLKRVEGSDNT